MFWGIILIGILLSIQLAVILRCLKSIKEIEQISREVNSSVKVIMRGKGEFVFLCVLSMFGPLTLSLCVWSTDLGGRVLSFIYFFLIFIVMNYGMVSWLDSIILYGEKGFSVGCIPSHVKYYYYEDITDVVYNKEDFAIFVGDFRIGSRYYKKGLKAFRDYILEKRKEIEVIDTVNKNLDMPLSRKLVDFFEKILFAGAIIVGMGIQFFNIWFVFFSEDESGIVLTMIVFLTLEFLAVLSVLEGIGYFAIKGRQCKISEQGLLVKYPWTSWNCIEWDQFRQICICYRGFNQYERYETVYKYDPIICFVKHGEKKNFHDRWNVDSRLHYKRVIWMDYTERLLEEVKEKCPYEVVDLRRTRQYRTDCKSQLR